MSTVIVAVSLVAIFGGLVLSLDTGNLWQSRRAMVTATDSGASRGAIVAGSHGTALTSGTEPCPDGTDSSKPNVEAAVLAMLTANSATATLDDCSLTSSVAHVGWITVDARKPVANRFGVVVGAAGDGSAFSSTTVQFGYPPAVVGLRPIGVCVEGEHIREWLHLKDPSNPYGSPDPFAVQHDAGDSDEDAFGDLPVNDPLYTAPLDLVGETKHYYWNGDTDHVVHRVFFTKDNPEECGGEAPGNWGFQDYDGGANSNADMEDWIRFGYHETAVGIGDCGWDNEVENEPCDGDTGVSGCSICSALDSILNKKIPIMIYDSVTGVGSGVDFNVYAFVGVILRDYRMTGAEGKRYFDIEFADIQLSGPCCLDDGVWTGALNLEICSVDHDPQTLETRCSPMSP